MEELVLRKLGLPGPSKPTSSEGKAAASRSSDKRAKPKKATDKMHRLREIAPTAGGNRHESRKSNQLRPENTGFAMKPSLQL